MPKRTIVITRKPKPGTELKPKSKMKQIKERLERDNWKRKPTTKRLTKVDKTKRKV